MTAIGCLVRLYAGQKPAAHPKLARGIAQVIAADAHSREIENRQQASATYFAM